MAAAPSIVVKTRTILRAWQAGAVPLWLEFVPDRDDDVQAIVTDAVERANSEFDTGEGGEAGWDALVGCPSVPPTGPRTYQMHLDKYGEPEALEHWLGTFAQALQAAGLSGTVTAARPERYPSYQLVERLPRHQLTAYVAYTLEQPLVQPFGWSVDDDTTRRMLRHVGQAAFPGGETFLGLGRVVRTDLDVAIDTLERVLPGRHRGQLTFLRAEPPKVTLHMFQTNGRGSRVVHDPALGWRERLDLCTDLLTGVPDRTSVGLVEPARGYLSGWEMIGRSMGLPGSDAADFRYHADLLPEYVPDARGAWWSPTPTWPRPTI